MHDASFKINFGNEAVSIPFAAVTKFEKATKKDIKILVCLCALGRLATDVETAVIVSSFGHNHFECILDGDGVEHCV